MARIFISYDREDSDFAELVEGRLTRAGHDTRLDVEILDAGEDWRDALDQALRESDVLVVVMTPEARGSDYVTYEWAFALGAGVRIIPLVLKETAFHPRLDVLQHLDFTNKQRPWEILLQEVDKAAQARRITTVSVPADAPPTVKSAVIALDSLDTNEQVAGVKALAVTDHPAAREALVAALEHPVKSVRMAVALEFPDRTDARRIPGLLAASQDEVFQRQWYPERYDFAAIVAQIGPPAIPYLLDSLQDPDNGTRWFGLLVLGRIGDKRVAADVIDMLQDNFANVRWQAAKTLGLLGDNAAVPPLVHALHDENENVRRYAAEALGQLNAGSAANELIGLLEDPSSSVRVAVVTALGFSGGNSVTEKLIERLNKDNSDVRAAAAVALGRIGAESALHSLIDRLRDTEEKYLVRKAAVQALGLLGGSAAENALKTHLSGLCRHEAQKTDSPLTVDIAEALVTLRCIDSFPLLADTLSRSSDAMKLQHVVDSLVSCGSNAVPVLACLLNHRSTIIQSKSATALREIGTGEARAALEKWEQSR